MKRLLVSTAVAATAVATSLSASAQFQRPDDAVKYRKGVLFAMGQHFGRIGAMAQGRVPFDAKMAADNADIVATLSKLPFAGFVDGTDKGDTRALPAIWTERAKFDAAAGKMQEEVAKLAAAAKSNNLDQLKAAFGPAAQSCKACHDNFRKD
ncbi:cytochrome c [Azohydromonas sp.]|uniref:c-type cytochrome n=1 Tax=Azohydromonas sp. TaxID=1872666 RepID=UPI002BA80A9D|nr:cytochrome c [Azohydromonas sp.]HMM85513.1 cytochrome c [Azohydromonas sp.]